MSGSRPTSLLAAVALLAGGLWLALSGAHQVAPGAHQAALVEASARARTFAVTAGFKDSSVLRNERTVLSGTVAPVRTSTRVLIQRLVGDKWKTLARRTMNDDGGYRFAFKTNTAGTYTYRARMPKVGAVKAGNSPEQVLTVAQEALVVFHIPANTGAGSWNAQDTEVVAKVGDTLRIVNDDSEAHRPHTGGAPFPHPALDIPPGASTDYQLTGAFTGSLHCHIHGLDSKFWIDVTEA